MLNLRLRSRQKINFQANLRGREFVDVAQLIHE